MEAAGDLTSPRRPLRPRALVGVLLALAAGAPLWAGPADEVDPFIGTGGHGHTYPGATRPFGMVQLSPDTRLEGWDGCAGYHATDDVIYGFSHTHLSGTGIPDYGDVLLMPITGPPRLRNGHDGGEGYSSRFDKGSERASPGHYAVQLIDAGVFVELTATERAGMHRYRFPPGRPAHVVVDLTHRDRVLDSSLRVVGDRRIEGSRRSTGWARDQQVFFVAEFSRAFRASLARDDEPVDGAQALDGKSVKAILSFGSAGGELIVKVGLSAVDVAGADGNLVAEIPGWEFDAVREEARDRWNDALGAVRVTGGAPEQRRIFYTALYHSLLAPNVYSDVDGRYRGMDGSIHLARRRRQYTVFSLWDTFRATHPLFTLIEPERTGEFIETFLAMYEQGGRLPVWELAANETDTMIGYHSIPVIADAWIKGIRSFDGERALQAMIHSAELDRNGLEAYRRQGFVGADDDSESVSKTLEYAYDDACIARMAADLGRDQVAAEFHRRSQAWRHLLDPESGFFRARENQRWIEPFDPRRVDNHYTEANAWQYSLFVPHDLDGLMEALGGDEALVDRLDALFAAEPRTTGREQADITGLIGQYAHGNEPSHHMAWLYHYAGRPDLTAARVRTILDSLYGATPDGLSGNDDCGQMSSWYVLAAIGLYPVCPCTDEYALSAPLFDEVRLRLAGDRTFVIRRRGEGPFVRSATLDGRPWSRSFLTHGRIAGGGELQITLGPAPGAWGREPRDRPHTATPGPRVLAAPFAVAAADTFRGSLEVVLRTAEPGARIRFSLAGDAPEEEWPDYTAPLVLEGSQTVKFLAEREGERSPAVTARFHRIPHDWSVDLAHPPAPQYSAGGTEALIDGRRGGSNWRLGGWHGYRGQEMSATIDLGERRAIRRAGAGFLQDVGAWIWMPRLVVVSVSDDGRAFREVGRATSGVPTDREGVTRSDLLVDAVGVEGRYVQVRALPAGPIPDWHPGRGEAGWIFVDEILLETDPAGPDSR